jgi:putative MATE family efflux protein
VIINMILAPVLIFGWGTHRPLGVAGAALASLIAVVIGTFWLLTYFLKPGAFLRFVPADWRPRPDLWSAMLKVGLPAGAEFALMAVYLFIIYALSRPFGAAAQAGFGIGMRIMQAVFMPVVALGFAVGPVAGQNVGARLRERVIETFRSAVGLSLVTMLALAVLCHLLPAALVRVFSADPQVVAVGDEYLRIVSWNFMASGVIFVASSMFQTLGNTVPALLASLVRVFVLAIPAMLVARLPGFQLRWLWYLSVTSVTFQLILSLLLLRREFGRRLPVAAAVPAPALAIPAPVPIPAED